MRGWPSGGLLVLPVLRGGVAVAVRLFRPGPLQLCWYLHKYARFSIVDYRESSAMDGQ